MNITIHYNTVFILYDITAHSIYDDTLPYNMCGTVLQYTVIYSIINYTTEFILHDITSQCVYYNTLHCSLYRTQYHDKNN